MNARFRAGGVQGDEHGEDDHGDPGAEQELAVAHLREEALEHVLGEGDRWRQQGAGGGAHDHRQQGTEEDDLSGKGHVLHDQRRQDELRVVFHQALDHAWVDDLRRVGEEQRHRGKEEVGGAAQRRAPHRDGFVLRRVDALEHVLLRDGAQRHGQEGGHPGNDVECVQRGQEAELAFGGGLADDVGEAPRHVAGQPGDVEQAEHDDDHLHEGGHGDRPHAAEQGVQQHHRGADQHAFIA
ncbi:hypothetical protein SDC9_170048 [bioreactor metagenome]|uniref:Uncharacterized protein n=1 Tax=bioreactor metagenome TaxID=1076179 RepID=A0A645G7Q3_9ZZZZ